MRFRSDEGIPDIINMEVLHLWVMARSRTWPSLCITEVGGGVGHGNQRI